MRELVRNKMVKTMYWINPRLNGLQVNTFQVILHWPSEGNPSEARFPSSFCLLCRARTSRARYARASARRGIRARAQIGARARSMRMACRAARQRAAQANAAASAVCGRCEGALPGARARRRAPRRAFMLDTWPLILFTR